MNYLDLAEKNLSNNFTGKGEKKMSTIAATANMFKVDIANTGTTAVNVAIIPGHYPTLQVLGVDPAVLVSNSVSELVNAGQNVQAVLSSEPTTLTGGGTLTCSASDPAYTIESFLNYIKTNPMAVGQMRIRANTGNVSVFNNKFKFQKTNPFNQPEQIPINISKFFSTMQYQDGMIDIPMAETGLILDDSLLMIVTIPGNTSMGIDFTFLN